MPSPQGTQDVRYLPRTQEEQGRMNPSEPQFSHSSIIPSEPHREGVLRGQMEPQNIPCTGYPQSEPQRPTPRSDYHSDQQFNQHRPGYNLGQQFHQQRTHKIAEPQRPQAPESNYPMESQQGHRLGYQGPQTGYQSQNQDNQSISSSVQTQDSQESRFHVSQRMPYPSEPQRGQHPRYQPDSYISERTRNPTEPHGAQQRGYPSELQNDQPARYQPDSRISERTQNITEPPGAQQRGYPLGPQHMPGVRLQDNQRAHVQYPIEPPSSGASRYPSGPQGVQQGSRQLPGSSQSGSRVGNPSEPQRSQPSWHYQPNIPPLPHRMNNATNQQQRVLHLGKF